MTDSAEPKVEFQHSDWRPTRDALTLVYRAMGEPVPLDIPRRDWELASGLRSVFIDQHTYTCAECRKPIPYRTEITCLDCNAPLHKECAPRHFWPKGRPKNA